MTNDRADYIKVSLMNSDGEELHSKILDDKFTFIEKTDLQDILAMCTDIKQTLQDMRDDEHTWNEVRMKGNIEIYNQEWELTTRIIEKYG